MDEVEGVSSSGHGGREGQASMTPKLTAWQSEVASSQGKGMDGVVESRERTSGLGGQGGGAKSRQGQVEARA